MPHTTWTTELTMNAQNSTYPYIYNSGSKPKNPSNDSLEGIFWVVLSQTLGQIIEQNACLIFNRQSESIPLQLAELYITGHPQSYDHERSIL